MIPKCPMCGGKNFDRARNVLRGGLVRYSFLGDIAGRLSPTTLISSLPLRARACLDCGYVAMMIAELAKLHKLVEKHREEKGFRMSEEDIGESVEAIQQMEAEQPTVENSEVLADLDVTAEEEAELQVEAMETLADGPAAEATDEEGPLKDLTEAVEPDPSQGDDDEEGPQE